MERPLVGIVCSYNDIVPGHMNLDKIAQAVKLGVAMVENHRSFPAIAVFVMVLQWDDRYEIFFCNKRPDRRFHRAGGTGLPAFDALL